MINDTTITKALGSSKFSGYLELYNDSMDTLLFKYRDRRFLISNRLTISGVAEEAYLVNKIRELIYTDIIALIPDFIYRFEWPEQRRKAIVATKFMLNNFFGILPNKPIEHSRNQIKVASTEIEKSDKSVGLN